MRAATAIIVILTVLCATPAAGSVIGMRAGPLRVDSVTIDGTTTALAFEFVAGDGVHQATGTALTPDALWLFVDSNSGAATYQVGLRGADANGAPSSSWLWQVGTSTPRIPSSGWWQLDPDTAGSLPTLTRGQTYFLVVQRTAGSGETLRLRASSPVANVAPATQRPAERGVWRASGGWARVDREPIFAIRFSDSDPWALGGCGTRSAAEGNPYFDRDTVPVVEKDGKYHAAQTLFAVERSRVVRVSVLMDADPTQPVDFALQEGDGSSTVASGRLVRAEDWAPAGVLYTGVVAVVLESSGLPPNEHLYRLALSSPAPFAWTAARTSGAECDRLPRMSYGGSRGRVISGATHRYDLDALFSLLACPAPAPACSRNRGVCAGAYQHCATVAGGAEWQDCAVAGFEATEHSCDGLDNDCNGDIDENGCAQADGGAVTDAGPAADASGAEADGGAESDSGPLEDAGAPSDAAEQGDAQDFADAGPGSEDSGGGDGLAGADDELAHDVFELGGCGCSSTGPVEAAWGCLALLVASRRRRRAARA